MRNWLIEICLLVVHVRSAIVLAHVFRAIILLYYLLFRWWYPSWVYTLATRIWSYKWPLDFMTVKLEYISFNSCIKLFLKLTCTWTLV